MTETTILTVCFLITFGFIGYKLFNFIKQALVKYSQTIEDNINESERIKIQAINILEDAQRREMVIADELEKAMQLINQKMHNIEIDFDTKLKKTLQNLTENSDKKIDFERNCTIDTLKENLKSKIIKTIQDYMEDVPDYEKENATMQAILKIDFKKLAKKN